QSRPQAAGQPAQAAGEERERGLPRDRRGPRGRGHRLAPGPHPQCPAPRAPVCRVSLPETPPGATPRAVASPRELDTARVDAQETRRILDRLYGYEVSPVLWKKVLPKLSAGRVQSVATRIVVERERERMAFH